MRYFGYIDIRNIYTERSSSQPIGNIKAESVVYSVYYPVQTLFDSACKSVYKVDYKIYRNFNDIGKTVPDTLEYIFDTCKRLLPVGSENAGYKLNDPLERRYYSANGVGYFSYYSADYLYYLIYYR